MQLFSGLMAPGESEIDYIRRHENMSKLIYVHMYTLFYYFIR